MIQNIKNNRNIILLYVFFILYILTRSMLFCKFKINTNDYLINFKGGNYYIIHMLPIYLIGLSILIKNDNIYNNYRLEYRTSIVTRHYKIVIIHSITFVSLNFIIGIFLFNKIYNFLTIHSISYFLLLQVLHMLGYILIGGMVLLLKQINITTNINQLMLVYVLIIIEYFLLFENILSSKIPLIISWVFIDTIPIYKIVILTILNNVVYRLVYNKSLSREFVGEK